MKNNNVRIILFFIATIIIVGGLYFFVASKNKNSKINPAPVVGNIVSSTKLGVASSTPQNNSVLTKTKNGIVAPISNALVRVTKKPFGLKVSPNNSPVSPEKFTGYHTGVDFETYLEEQNIAVPIYAFCSGQLAVKEYASGYGGVAVQRCVIDGEAVTVIYGHLKLASIVSKVGQELLAGEQLGILGQAYSKETDGERKHLHLGIHKGSIINIKGYVQTPTELDQWLDATQYLK